MNWMFLPLRRYAEFSGRSRRIEFWLFFLFQALVGLVFGAIFGVTMFSAFSGGTPNFGAMFASLGIAFLLFGLFGLAMLLPTLAVSVRRLHDSDRSGWWLMLYIGPYLLLVVMQFMVIATRSPALVIVNGLIVLGWLVAAIVLLVFMCLPGTVGANRFGPDPMNPDRDFAETFR